MTTLRTYRIEIKYTLLTLGILGIAALLNTTGVFNGVETDVNHWMDRLAEYGYIGLFIIALFSNMTLVFIIPYALPLLTLSIYASSILKVVWLGVAAGVGAGIGEVASYAVAHALVTQFNDLEQSALFRWTKRTIDAHPRTIPVLVWLASGTPAPDMVIIVPLAMIRYPWQKMVLPMISGKIFQNVVMALVYRFAADYVQGLVSENIHFDLTAILAIIFVMLIAYQIEKAHAERRTHTPPVQGTHRP
jgi:membrane protein YqaA with SNARE-associated domain